MAKTRDPLTARQAAFVREYLVDNNGKQAAIRAGYAESGAEVEASRLLRVAKVRHEVEKGRNRLAKARGVSAQVIFNRLDDVAGFDPAELFDDNGHFLPIHAIPRELRVCIKEMEVRADWEGSGPDKTQVAQITKLKFYDRVKANELIGKNLKMFVDEVEVNHKHTLEDLIAGAGRDVTPRPQIESGEDE